MTELRKRILLALLCEVRGLPKEEAEDLILATQYAVNDFKAGECTEYSSIVEVVADYLSLDYYCSILFDYDSNIED